MDHEFLTSFKLLPLRLAAVRTMAARSGPRERVIERKREKARDKEQEQERERERERKRERE